ncbi:hypothetical protein BV509_09080 [Rhodovulum sulfidophilum]|uniref:Uncharacterized protein n=1 Tax=Rhodovulum visakhapatnamense TaxID=364297 RepID=A0ABS1RI84_9RHOB|nr:hypothetical protein [Rhodovulum visakhapatnamense]MBL3568863.1 hypothetical protein [Rhodovulum visakhapatnamense]MBL3579229.1 hypothetical protein [Rhodovulum visakhapatnamense]OLS44479.1 hypothetical protein BV509_09080 [Rhodovulum sulfidophilum]
MIRPHQLRAFEATQDMLQDLRGLLTSLDLVQDQLYALEPDHIAQAIRSLIRMADSKLGEIEKAREKEFVAQGGISGALTEAEVREAAGEFADDVLRRRAELDAARTRREGL